MTRKTQRAEPAYGKAQGAEPFWENPSKPLVCGSRKAEALLEGSRKKAQGAIEYLLIIGAAILVVAVVISVIASSVNQGQTQGTTAQENEDLQKQKLQCLGDCQALGDGTCTTTTNCGQFTTLCKPINGTNGICVKK